MRKTCLFIILFAAFTVGAIESQHDVLTIDRLVPNSVQFEFPNDKNIKPKSSDFELVNCVMMSSEAGERWAVLTLTNISSGHRILEKEHILATFADGTRKSPNEIKLSFAGGDTQSITVSFGEYKFPVLSIAVHTRT